jgi:hypothetical protein
MDYIKDYIDFTDIDDLNDPIIVDFIGFEDFRDFLEENGVLDKFVSTFYNYDNETWKKNYWSGYKGNDDNYTLHDFLIRNKKFNYIDDIFRWEDTSDGYDFWYGIRGKWKRKNGY